jgi:hypothetical protein
MAMLRTLVVVIALASAAVASPLDPKPVAPNELPKGVTARGTITAAYTFTDKNGANYVVFSATSSTKQTQYAPSFTNWLYVEDWVVPAKGAPRNLLPVRDFVADCVMGDATAKFHDDAFTVTDLDHDGIAEITFGYELANCRSDVRPATYKLLLIANGAKYILRGETHIKEGGGPTGGGFTPDPVEAKWPAAFLAHAKDIWSKTSGDLQIPP